jgi:hypothetical protein
MIALLKNALFIAIARPWNLIDDGNCYFWTPSTDFKISGYKRFRM